MTAQSMQHDIEHLRAEVARLYKLIDAERQERVSSIASLEAQISTGMTTIKGLLEHLTMSIVHQDATLQALFSEMKANIAQLADRDHLKDDQLHQMRGQIDNLTAQISVLTTISAENAASVGLWHTFRTDALDLMRGLAGKIDAQGADLGGLRVEFARLSTKAAVDASYEKRDKERLNHFIGIIKMVAKPQVILALLGGLVALGALGENVLKAVQTLLGG